VIARTWNGWTTPANASRYQDLLLSTIFPAIAARGVTGYRGIHLLRRSVGEEVEFTTIMWFDSWDAVREFAGEDLERAVVPPAARAVLARFDERSRHSEVVASLDY
jgi:heme-degrading monooxygenase HmoA